MASLTNYYTGSPPNRYMLHLPLWVAYHYVWWIVAMGNPVKAAHVILFSPQIITFAFYVVFQALAVYFNLYYLVPRHLERGEFLKYTLTLGPTLISAALFIVSGYYLSAFIFDIDLESIYGGGTHCFFFFFGEAFPSTVASSTLAMSLKLIKDRVHVKPISGSPDKNNTDFFFVKCGNKFEKIRFSEILYIEGMQNYVTIYTTKEKYITLLTMKALEQDLSDSDFIRVHKSYIVSIGKITGLRGNEIVVGADRIPVSRTYRKKVKQVLGQLLWEK